MFKSAEKSLSNKEEHLNHLVENLIQEVGSTIKPAYFLLLPIEETDNYYSFLEKLVCSFQENKKNTKILFLNDIIKRADVETMILGDSTSNEVDAFIKIMVNNKFDAFVPNFTGTCASFYRNKKTISTLKKITCECDFVFLSSLSIKRHKEFVFVKDSLFCSLLIVEKNKTKNKDIHNAIAFLEENRINEYKVIII